MNTVKVGIVSDIHSEHWNRSSLKSFGGLVQQNLAAADIVLLAGDIGSSTQAIGVAKRLFPSKPVCIIAGNHEFYDLIVTEVLMDMESAAKSTKNIHFLNRSTFITNDLAFPLRVLGTTLWTDYDLFGTAPLSMVQARGFPDFKRILKKQGEYITAEDCRQWYERDMAWLLGELDQPFDGATVVMVHHSPVSFAMHPYFDGDSWNPCFASRMDNMLVRDDLAAVVWGHTHHSMDRTTENTRFVSNQMGYLQRQRDHTGKQIDAINGQAGTVIELTRS